MQPIALTPTEQAALKARKSALDNCRESIAFQTTAETIAHLHEATGTGWTISPDFSQLVPPPTMAALNIPMHREAMATIPTDGPR